MQLLSHHLRRSLKQLNPLTALYLLRIKSYKMLVHVPPSKLKVIRTHVGDVGILCV